MDKHTRGPIQGTGNALEDTVNELMALGVSRGIILGNLLRIVRYFLGNPGGVLIDEDGDGDLTGLVFGNPQLIELVATLAETEHWELTTFAKPATGMDAGDADTTHIN